MTMTIIQNFVDLRAKMFKMVYAGLPISKIFALKSTISELLQFLHFFGLIFELFVLIEFTTKLKNIGHFQMRTNTLRCLIIG